MTEDQCTDTFSLEVKFMLLPKLKSVFSYEMDISPCALCKSSECPIHI